MKADTEVNPPQYIDCSGMCEFHRCPTKYLLNRLVGIEPVSFPGDKSPSILLDYGKGIHLVATMCYPGAAGAEAAIEKFKLFWGACGYGNDDVKRNVPRASSSLRDLMKFHSPCPYKLCSIPLGAKYGDVAVNDYEVPFMVDVGAELPLAGRIDGFVQWLSTGQYWVLEYKTTSEISARYFDNHDMAPASVLYCVAMSQLMDTQVDGMIVEAIRVSPTNTETFMHLLPVSSHQVSLATALVRNTASDILRCIKNNEWPQQITGCSSYSMFGQPSGQCKFKAICRRHDVLSSALGTPMYQRVKPYNPFELTKGE